MKNIHSIILHLVGTVASWVLVYMWTGGYSSLGEVVRES